MQFSRAIRQPFEDYSRLKRVTTFIEEHGLENFELKTAARIAGMEEESFSRFFHEKVGVRFPEWLVNIRIREAISLMHNEKLPMREITFRVGYGDRSTFGRAFKKVTGLTPRQFKKLLESAVATRRLDAPDVS